MWDNLREEPQKGWEEPEPIAGPLVGGLFADELVGNDGLKTVQEPILRANVPGMATGRIG